VFTDWSLSSESRSKKYADGNIRRLELRAVKYWATTGMTS